MAYTLSFATEVEMHKVAELERLALIARQQAAFTTNRETSEMLLGMARKFTKDAADRKAALANRQCETARS